MLISRKGAGGYQIQGESNVFIEKINGCYSNVKGLPSFKFVKALISILKKYEAKQKTE